MADEDSLTTVRAEDTVVEEVDVASRKSVSKSRRSKIPSYFPPPKPFRNAHTVSTGYSGPIYPAASRLPKFGNLGKTPEWQHKFNKTAKRIKVMQRRHKISGGGQGPVPQRQKGTSKIEKRPKGR